MQSRQWTPRGKGRSLRRVSAQASSMGVALPAPKPDGPTIESGKSAGRKSCAGHRSSTPECRGGTRAEPEDWLYRHTKLPASSVFP
jgi:hypothetical protein